MHVTVGYDMRKSTTQIGQTADGLHHTNDAGFRFSAFVRSFFFTIHKIQIIIVKLGVNIDVH